MKKWISILIFCCLFFTVNVRAGVIYPSEDLLDVRYINAELKETGYVKLAAGKTYYLVHYIALNSNQTIDATGATIIVDKGAARNDPINYRTGYDSMSNVTIKGGTWISNKIDGNPGTAFSLAHCQNITLEGMDIRTTNAESHAIEIVGCKNITIKNCRVTAQGKGSSKSAEEMIQIDLSAPNSAPFLKSEYWNGLTCQNITVDSCTVTGNRAVCANFPGNDKQYLHKMHKNIVIKNCRLTGNTAEALALFNSANLVVKNNTIITKSKRTKESYSTGCHIAAFGTIPKLSKSRIEVKNNTIKGGKYGFQLSSHSKSRYGKLIITNNKIYCKKGKKNGLAITMNHKRKKSVKVIKESNNKIRKWKK